MSKSGDITIKPTDSMRTTKPIPADAPPPTINWRPDFLSIDTCHSFLVHEVYGSMSKQGEGYPPVVGGAGCMGDIVLVTGASGFIGSHIVANLLASGKSVRASVRDLDDPEKVDHLKALPVADGGSLELVKMDLFDVAAVKSAVAGCSDVIHAAAALHVGNMDKQKDVVDPSLIGTQNI